VTRKGLKDKAQKGQEIYLHRQIYIEAGTQSSPCPLITKATIPCYKGAGALRRPHVSVTVPMYTMHNVHKYKLLVERMEHTSGCGEKVQSSRNGVKLCLFKALSEEVFTRKGFLISPL
jgi:hypothetical protein